jgi:hypothetical protein
VWFSDLTAPGNGTAATQSFTMTYGCQWASDHRSILFWASVGWTPQEIWIADRTQPGTARLLREPLATGETFYFFDTARRSTAAILSIRPASGGFPDFYRASIDAPGISVKFANGDFVGSFVNPIIDAGGTLLAFTSDELVDGGPQTIRNLTVASTQVFELGWPLTRTDSVTGVFQYAFVTPP